MKPEPIEAENELRWRAVQERDGRFAGQFYFGVRSTGVFCRPGCPARTPHREQVLFFDSIPQAREAGYRPCRRCRPEESDARQELVERAMRVIEGAGEVLSLAELGRRVGMSPYHLQRVFKAVTGLTPRQYGLASRLERFKTSVRQGEDVTSALYTAGFGSSSRLYEGAARRLGMTPGAYREGGLNMEIKYTLVPTGLGWLLLAATPRGVCKVAFGESQEGLSAELAAEFPRASVQRDDSGLAGWAASIVRHIDGIQPALDLPLDVRATEFQQRVWAALRQIPYGETRTYAQLAAAVGQPAAVRAVARACASNPVALINPCHRVVRSDGGLGGYRWGIQRKKDLLEQEFEKRR